mmetsp:Transcript_3385/g.5135  ORF Transcript_3385/g.5135 Transcript_3385/m.5135 type:complete len:231 (-) Transcript_3385:241-933(-)
MYQKGRIVAKRIGSPTVTILDLVVPLIQFQPGQWIDFKVPSESWTGGFSITNLPDANDRIQIAVKCSTHAPAQWITNQSKVGDDVTVQVGGTCLLHSDKTREACFLAGGIGISPMLCLYRQHTKERQSSASFFYSVATEDELVYRTELENLLRPQDQCTMALTQSLKWEQMGDFVSYLLGRTALTEFIQHNLTGNKIYYICGPPSMQEQVFALLQKEKVPCKNIVYEKWW